MDTQVYLKGISYELGEPRGIQQLSEVQQDPELLERLLSVGIASYSSNRQTPAEMAAACAARTLWKTKTDPKTVDLLIFATSSFWEPQFYGRDIHWLITKLGLDNAYPLGVTLSECANLLVALSVAADSLRQGRSRRVLVVTADKVRDGETRIVPPEVSVASDAAASVLVTLDAGPYELLATDRYMIPLAFERAAHENFTQYLKTSARGIYVIAERTLAAVGKRAEDFSRLITNNYNLSVSKLFATQSGFDLDRVYTANIARYGHGFGADNLVNLADCAGENPPLPDDLFCLLASGPNMWATAVLRKT
jgi:3-oxoacyl-[acyl-carrier-protein] synthase-3